MKKLLVVIPVLFVFFLLNSCKKDPDIAEILKIVQELKLQNDNLKAELAKQSERLDALLQMMNGTNQQVTDLVKKIDTLSKEIASILAQIDVLNKELKNTDADVAKILEQIAVLQKQSADLVAQINQLTAIPATPTLLEASSITDQSLVLTWKDNANNEIGFKIERKISDGIWETIAVLNANTTTYTLTALTENTEYTFRVLAYNLGVSLYSNSVSPKTLLRLEVAIKNGLMAYYPFNGNANDESGNGNHGIIQGGVTGSTDRFNKLNSAFLFNGTNGNILIPSLNNIPYKPISYSGWIIINNTFPFNFGFKKKVIVGRDQIYKVDQGAIVFSSEGTNGFFENQLLYYIGANALPNTPINATNLSIGSWTHFAFTQDENGNFKWYINGVLTNSGKINNIQGANIPFIIGSGNARDFWDNKLDDIRIHNRVISQPEISYLASN
jgi:hypothetical protein